MEIGYSTADGHELWAVNRTAPFEGGTIQWVTNQGGVRDGVFVRMVSRKDGLVWLRHKDRQEDLGSNHALSPTLGACMVGKQEWLTDCSSQMTLLDICTPTI